MPAVASVLAGHRHVFEPAAQAGGRTLLLLHGTGADETDLLPLGRALAPDANLLSPRGNVVEHGMPRWFRRFAEGVLDEEDLAARAEALGAFVEEAARTYGLDPSRVTALGYSNGANVAAGLLLGRPRLLAGAVLLRAMAPYARDVLPGEPVRGPVLVLAGRRDPYAVTTERLAAMLRAAGARVDVTWSDAGHELGAADAAAARAWLAARREEGA